MSNKDLNSAMKLYAIVAIVAILQLYAMKFHSDYLKFLTKILLDFDPTECREGGMENFMV